jgi:hypothetical protein
VVELLFGRPALPGALGRRGIDEVGGEPGDAVGGFSHDSPLV